jgi:hypothetical protein
MPVSTRLTNSMLQHLARIPQRYKEKGDANDETQLCNSWKGALNEDKIELEKLVIDPDIGGKLSAGMIKQEYTKYQIYTTACMQNSIRNYCQKAKEAIKKRSESKLYQLITSFHESLTHLFSSLSCSSVGGRWWW